MYLSRRLPLVTAAELESRARLFSRELAAAGVTAFTDATVRNGPEEVELMARLLGGRVLAQRVAMMLGAPYLTAFDEAMRIAHPAGIMLVASSLSRVREPTTARSHGGSRGRARRVSTRPFIAPRSKTWSWRSMRSSPPRAGRRPHSMMARFSVSSMAG